MPGNQATNRVYQVNWTQNLSKSTERALALDASLSYQKDQFVSSPLTASEELSTRSPFGGFLLKPFDFMWDFDNFPIDSQLIDNYRYNRLGSRRSPLDLENTDQYIGDVPEQRYGLPASERGGPRYGAQNRENR